LENIRAAHAKWISLKWRTDSEMIAVWKRAFRYLRRKENIMNGLREGHALQVIGRFVPRVIIPFRAARAWNMSFDIRTLGEEIGETVAIASVRRVRGAIRKRASNACTRFAEAFTGCLAELSCSLAQYSLTGDGIPAIPCSTTPNPVGIVKAIPEDESLHPERNHDIKRLPGGYPTRVVQIERDYSRDDSWETSADEPTVFLERRRCGENVRPKATHDRRLVICETTQMELFDPCSIPQSGQARKSSRSRQHAV
jgi:hypothetical protein